MKPDQTGDIPPHMWRSQFHPSSATHRRPRGSVTPGQLWGWIIALAVVLAIIIAIVWLVLPGNEAQVDTEGAAATTTLSDGSQSEATDSAGSDTSN